MALPVQNSPPDLSLEVYDKNASINSKLDYIESQQRSLIAKFEAGERTRLRTRLRGDQSVIPTSGPLSVSLTHTCYLC
ncbi:hypothetical protein LguiA_001830 [Lonicera macranthoides]